MHETAVRQPVDVRLAVPVAAAWMLTAAMSPRLEHGWLVSAVCFGVAALALVITRGQRMRAAGVGVLVAVSAALGGLTVAAATAAAPPDIDTCSTSHLRVIEHGTSPVLVNIEGSRCDGVEQPAATALLVEATGPNDESVETELGAVLTGTCDAWRAGSSLMLRCTEVSKAEIAEWAHWATELRSRLRAAVSALPGDGAALLPGLAIGDVSAVDTELERAMLESGLTHLTAVSGANCAIVVAVGFAMGIACGFGRTGRVVLGLVLLVGFVVLVGPDPSVLRASVMALLALWALWRGARRTGISLVAVAVLVLLLTTPRLATAPGLALSVLATCGLMVHGLSLTRWLSQWVPTWFAAAIAVPFAAQVWCMPVLVALDARLSLVSLPANMLAAPAAPIATIAGVVTCIATLIHPAAAMVAAWIGWVPASWIAAVARIGDRLDWNVPWPAGWWGIALAIVMLAAVVYGVMARRVARALGALVMVVIVAVSSVQVPILAFALRLPEWSFAQCDVGQGSASVARVRDAIVVLDTGPDPDLLDSCLQRLAITHVDLLVLTHFDLDHVGGSATLFGKVTTVVHGPEDADGAALTEQFHRAGAQVFEVAAGDSIALGESRIDVLWPPADEPPGNDASVVTNLRLSGVTVTVLGDLGADAQRRLMRFVSASDVVVVAHHGSRDQAIELYEHIGARLAIVPVGENNYGHPHASLIGSLTALGTAVVRTDTHGLVALNSVEIWSEH